MVKRIRTHAVKAVQTPPRAKHHRHSCERWSPWRVWLLPHSPWFQLQYIRICQESHGIQMAFQKTYPSSARWSVNKAFVTSKGLGHPTGFQLGLEPGSNFATETKSKPTSDAAICRKWQTAPFDTYVQIFISYWKRAELLLSTNPPCVLCWFDDTSGSTSNVMDGWLKHLPVAYQIIITHEVQTLKIWTPSI